MGITKLFLSLKTKELMNIFDVFVVLVWLCDEEHCSTSLSPQKAWLKMLLVSQTLIYGF